MLGRRLGARALQVPFSYTTAVAPAPPLSGSSLLCAACLQSLTTGASWQAYSTYAPASTIVVDSPAELRQVLPSDLKETLGIQQQCMYWWVACSRAAAWHSSSWNKLWHAANMQVQ
jgi:hypothetical protein